MLAIRKPILSEQERFYRTASDVVDNATKMLRNLIIALFHGHKAIVFDSPCEFHRVAEETIGPHTSSLIGLFREYDNGKFDLHFTSNDGEQTIVSSDNLSLDEMYGLCVILYKKTA